MAQSNEGIERWMKQTPNLTVYRGRRWRHFFNAGLITYRSCEFTVVLFRDEYQVPLLDPEPAARIATIPSLSMLTVTQTFVYPNAWPEHLV